jgi:hypothetical protein
MTAAADGHVPPYGELLFVSSSISCQPISCQPISGTLSPSSSSFLAGPDSVNESHAGATSTGIQVFNDNWAFAFNGTSSVAQAALV